MKWQLSIVFDYFAYFEDVLLSKTKMLYQTQ